MHAVCLDLESVLVPEIWIEVAHRTGIEALQRTTRDEPDYDALMCQRIELLRRHGLRLVDVQQIVADMHPLDGADAFLDELRSRYPVLILSDTFHELAQPLLRQLHWPTLLCHRLEVDAAGFVHRHVLRQVDQKRRAVEALRSLNFSVIAAGDSYNDTGMLEAAHAGIFIHPPPSVATRFPQFPITRSFAELASAIDAAAARLGGGKGR